MALSSSHACTVMASPALAIRLRESMLKYCSLRWHTSGIARMCRLEMLVWVLGLVLDSWGGPCFGGCGGINLSSDDNAAWRSVDSLEPRGGVVPLSWRYLSS